MVKATIVIALAGMGAVCSSGAGAQGVPAERSVPAPIAQSSRGFTSVTSVRELGGGRTLVADRGERRLYVVNWETAAVDQVLRQGDGPREYREIGWLYAIADNETLLTTLGRQWILLRDTQVAQTFIGTSPLNRRSRARLDGVATGGSVLASISGETPGNFIADERVLELAPGLGPDQRLPRLDTVRRVKGAGRDQLACVLGTTRGAPRCRFLEAEEQAILFPDGWIAVALHDPYRVDWRSPDGAWIRGELLDAAVPVSEAEKCAAINGWAEGNIGCNAAAVGSYVWPETIPPFLTDSRSCRACSRVAAGAAPWLFADPRGRLVVRRTPHQSRRENLYDIVDRAGRLVERVILPHGEAIVGFGGSSLYTIRMDEYDLQWLRRHPWRD
jgi:hypothetical protein